MPHSPAFIPSSKRLHFSPVTPADFAELLAVYNSNPDYMEYAFGKRAVTVQEIEADHLENLALEDSYSVALRESANGNIIGIAQFILCNPRDKQPWLGLIMLHSDCQGKGYAKEFLDCLIDWYRENGYTSLHLAVLATNSKVVPFYEKYGFTAYEERKHERLGRVICMAYAF